MSRRFFMSSVVAWVLLNTAYAEVTKSAAPVLGDERLRTACGPIARHVALRLLGVEQELAESVRACQWKEGELTTLATLHRSLNEVDDVRCHAVRLSPDELWMFLSRPHAAAILAVRKGSAETNHVVCAYRDSATGDLVSIDYPELDTILTPATLLQVWDGEALLVSRKEPLGLGRLLIFACAPGLLLGGLLWVLINRRAQPNKAVESQSAPVPA